VPFGVCWHTSVIGIGCLYTVKHHDRKLTSHCKPDPATHNLACSRSFSLQKGMLSFMSVAWVGILPRQGVGGGHPPTYIDSSYYSNLAN
jgi:hypothetical protein